MLHYRTGMFVVFLLSKYARGELATGLWRPYLPPQICGRHQRSVAECGVEPNTPIVLHVVVARRGVCFMGQNC
jgi:hypothetical protein